MRKFNRTITLCLLCAFIALEAVFSTTVKGDYPAYVLADILLSQSNKAKANQELSVKSLFEYEIESGTVTITKYKGCRNYLRIPSQIDGLPVRKIASHSFSDRDANAPQILIIPEGVTTIGERAFYGSFIHRLVLPSSAVNIGYEAFHGTWMSTEYKGDYQYTYKHNGLFSNLHTYQQGTYTLIKKSDNTNIPTPGSFFKCWEDFAYIEKDEAIWIIGYFGDNPDVVIPASINNLPVRTIYDMNEQGITSVTIPEGVTTIEDGAFCGCKSLKSVKFPKSLQKIGAFAFYSCSSLTSVTIPDNLTTAGSCSFAECQNLKSVTFLGGKAPISTNMFTQCEKLESVTLSEDLTTIRDYAFYNCPNLKSITIPKSVTEFGTHIFSAGKDSHPNILVLSVLTWQEQFPEVDEYGYYLIEENPTPNKELTIRTERGAEAETYAILNDYKFAYLDKVDPEKAMVDRMALKTKLKELGFEYEDDGSFIMITKYKGSDRVIEIPYGVSVIAPHTFEDCKMLKIVKIPDSVRCIGKEAFAGCKLRYVIIPESVSYMEKDIFPNDKSYQPTMIWAPSSSSEFTMYCKEGSKAEEYAKDNHLSYSTDPAPICDTNGLWYSHDKKTLLLFSKDLPEEFTIPSGITTIGENAFANCKTIVFLTIPEGVTNIESRAFHNCENLMYVITPESLTDIADDAFCFTSGDSDDYHSYIPPTAYGKENSAVQQYAKQESSDLQFQNISGINISEIRTVVSLAHMGFRSTNNRGYVTILGYRGNESAIEIPEGVNAIAKKAFEDCEKLKSVKIPDSVQEIGYSAFSGCTNLTEVKIPDSVQEIEDSAFYGCTNLTEVKIPDGIQAIGSSAFSGCTSLKEVKIPDSVQEIGEYAFSGCTSLKEVKMPDIMREINHHAFAGCTSLKSITIPRNTEINSEVFKNCTGLTSVTILYGVTYIDGDTFANCISLTSVTIPQSVTNIEYHTFSSTPKLTIYGVKESSAESFANHKQIKFQELDAAGKKLPIESTLQRLGFEYSIYGDDVIITRYVGRAANVKIPHGVTIIRNSAFRDCRNLRSVTIPDSVRYIGDYAFKSCESLTSVTIPNSVRYIGISTFSYCEGLTSVTIPNSVRYIGEFAFGTCTNLTSVTISDGVTTIAGSAFSRCTSLTSVTIPDGVRHIGDSAFSGCTSLTSVTIPDSVRHIRDHTFKYCTSLTSVKIPDSVQEIGYSAFADCTNLTEVKIPDSVQKIGSYAFADCTNLTIYGKAGSETERYAKEENIPFQEISE